MRVGIVGGGLMGVTLAYFLTKKYRQVTVVEQAPSLGGLSSEIQVDDHLYLSRYPNTILPYDYTIQAVCKQIGIGEELRFQPARTGFLHSGSIHDMSSLWDFLSFSPLTVWDRLQLGSTILQSRLNEDWRTLDRIAVKEWLIQLSGTHTFEQIWAPLLEAKFDYAYDEIPATYIWSWLNRMSSMRRGLRLQGQIGVFQRGQGSLIQALRDAIEAQGGQILRGVRAREIEITDGRLGRVRTNEGIMEFDLVIAALPTPEFAQLVLAADDHYRAVLAQSRYLGLVCPALVLKRPLTTYWTLNITDPSSPFSSIIQLQHPQNSRYHIVYLPKYTSPDHDWMGVPDEDIREAWLMRLRQIFPDFKPQEIVHFIVSRSRYAEPIHLINAAQRLLPVETPYPGLFLANTAQVYPDLPTSEATAAHAQWVANYVAQFDHQALRQAV